MFTGNFKFSNGLPNVPSPAEAKAVSVAMVYQYSIWRLVYMDQERMKDPNDLCNWTWKDIFHIPYCWFFVQFQHIHLCNWTWKDIFTEKEKVLQFHFTNINAVLQFFSQHCTRNWICTLYSSEKREQHLLHQGRTTGNSSGRWWATEQHVLVQATSRDVDELSRGRGAGSSGAEKDQRRRAAGRSSGEARASSRGAAALRRREE
jgi:hypothetical protein